MTRNFQCQPELTLRPWTPWSVKKMIQGLLGRLRIESIFQLEVTFLNFRFGNIFSSVTLYRYTIVYYISWVLRTMYIRISTSDRQKVLWYVIKALIWTKIGTNYWLFTLCFMFFVVKLVDWLEFSMVHDRIIFSQEKVCEGGNHVTSSACRRNFFTPNFSPKLPPSNTFRDQKLFVV